MKLTMPQALCDQCKREFEASEDEVDSLLPLECPDCIIDKSL